ncbi:uncharacterized protein LOC110995395 [Pieris rapae]|uniref:uncharacterized protein LOC110995395 n=1 Tax=Pieris rapae TaxID=64459 RepID=UPI001E28129D|nr:uncharacterized protein LOC110995395 [Pieris rapae]XP_022118241.2 uncharacterized protein LOC110995395 [Pieris rapae]
MPGYGPSQVKCEPPSDEEDNCQYGNYLYETHKPLNTEYDGDVSAEMLDQLQFSSELVAVPAAPAATPVCAALPAPREASLALLEPVKTHLMQGSQLMEKHISLSSATDILDTSDFAPLLHIKDEPLSEGEGQQLSGDEASEGSTPETSGRGAAKGWSPLDMEKALDALKNHHMSLTKASSTYGIPSTTLWQRAHRMGIDTPKKEGSSKSWTEDDLKAALHALRTGAISANKASKAYGIPSSTLYKIARREGIRLAAPFNAAPTSWRRADLQRALDAIRCGAASVQRAASHFGIPTGTLYGRCKREGIELSRSNPTPWSEDAMGEALEAVRVGQMSINQAAIHFNLPYSSLYGRFKRCKYQVTQEHQEYKSHEIRPEDIQEQSHPQEYFPSFGSDSYLSEVTSMQSVQQHYSQAMYYTQCHVTS